MVLKKIILLFGPTAAGKSRLAIDICKKFNGEIVNADSMQVYKEIKILSARPDKKTIKHHLYGFISARKNFSVGTWYKLAIKKIKEIHKKGKNVIVVGGTGLYFKALTDGLVEIPKVDKHDIDLNQMNKQKKIKDYAKKHPGIFDNINLNDFQRLYRAIAVYEKTGMTLSEWQSKKNKQYFDKDDFYKICLIPKKKEIERRIEKRFSKMLKRGAIEEAKNYHSLKLWKNKLHSANSIIGLREIYNHLHNKTSIAELKQEVLIRTRQYAKRQFTWQRGQMKDWKRFDDLNYMDLLKKVLGYLSKT